MSGLVFAPALRSAQAAAMVSATRAAACLPTGYSPHGALIAPGDILIPLRPVHSRFDLTPARDYNYPDPRAETGAVS